MRQCEIERVKVTDNPHLFKRTGGKTLSFIDCIDDKMIGKIISLKKEDGFWVINNVYGRDIDKTEINRSWHVGGL